MRIKMKRQAFTLIELLVIVAIIGILSGLAAVNYSRSRTRAYDTNIKTNTSSYRDAMELYYSQNKTYFVTNYQVATPTCTVGQRGDIHEYNLKGDGDACVGLYGGSQGMMTRRKDSATGPLQNYKSQSIADALVADGVLNRIETFPDTSNSDFSTYSSVVVDDTTYPADFVLTLCNSAGDQAKNEKEATGYAIYAALKSPSTSDTDSAAQLCGANHWNIANVAEPPTE